MPILTVELQSSVSLGHCYHGSTYKLTVTSRLSKKALHGMYVAGLFGAGQEFRVLSPCDGKEEPAGFETVQAKEYDMATMKVVNESPVNEFSKKPFPTMNEPFYVYLVERRTDSGD